MSAAICGSLSQAVGTGGDLVMVGYRRNFIPGGTYFFTVTLADRRSKMLVDQIGYLRSALRAARRERPFTIDAVVILPGSFACDLHVATERFGFFGPLAPH